MAGLRRWPSPSDPRAGESEQWSGGGMVPRDQLHLQEASVKVRRCRYQVANIVYASCLYSISGLSAPTSDSESRSELIRS